MQGLDSDYIYFANYFWFYIIVILEIIILQIINSHSSILINAVVKHEHGRKLSLFQFYLDIFGGYLRYAQKKMEKTSTITGC